MTDDDYINKLLTERDAARQEIVRLTDCLVRANDNHEKFERLWYLALHKIEDMQPLVIAATKLVNNARKCVDAPYMGCWYSHDTIESAIGDEVDALHLDEPKP